ncbi:MAG: ABC transporter substrate-binding protein [Phascolarctobacterium sp.]|nr:ABC transporter substrate-binding protein [Phascolarctobacterium sp.]
MKKIVKTTAAAAMIGLLALAVAGCGGGVDKKQAAKDTFKFGMTNFDDSLEPTENYFGWSVMRYGLGECLSKFDKQMKTVPCLAESWKVSDDKLTWTFKIRDNVVYSNGNKVTGEAAKKSIERTFAKSARAKAIFEYESITSDGQNVIIKTKVPVATLPGMLGDPLFIIIDTSVTDRDYAKQGPICTGPYMVKSYSKEKTLMEANPHYWGGAVPFKNLELNSINDTTTRAMALQSGEIDAAVNIAFGDLQLFQDKKKFHISEIGSLRDVLARINVREGGPLSDLRVRQALVSSLDRETYANVLLKGTFIAGGPYLPPSVDYGFDEIKKLDKNTYNVERAKKLLEEAGWKDINGDGILDKDGQNLELDFVYYSGRAELPLYAEATQSDAGKVGFKINLKNVDYNTIDGMGQRGEYDLMISNVLTMQAGDPEVFMNMYTRTNIDSSNPQNGGGYSNPKYDALGDQLIKEFDYAKRRELVIEMEKIAIEDIPNFVFGYPKTNMVSNLSITGAEILPCDYYWITTDIKPAGAK